MANIYLTLTLHWVLYGLSVYHFIKTSQQPSYVISATIISILLMRKLSLRNQVIW